MSPIRILIGDIFDFSKIIVFTINQEINMSKTNFPVKTAEFEKALPVWILGREREINLWLSFRTVSKGAKKTVLRLTGSSAYNVKINGNFIAFGPARCAHDFFRVDEIDISEYSGAPSVIAVDVAGYNADSFYHIDQPSFLCAELIEDGEITAATGVDGFICRVMTEHEQKAERFAGQRTFCEVYDFDTKYEKWYKDSEIDKKEFAIDTVVEQEEKNFIARGCEYNIYEKIYAEKIVSRLEFQLGDHKQTTRYPAYIVPRSTGSGPSGKHFTLSEVETDSFMEARNIDVTSIKEADDIPAEEFIESLHGTTYKMPFNTTGKIEFDAECAEDSEIIITFDEFIGEDKLINFRRMYTVNSLIWKIKKGSYHLSTFEPYTLGAMHIFVKKGSVRILSPYISYFGAAPTERKFIGEDKDLKKIFDAAVQTYRQNTFTIYMDCPSRERAGWLCDSFFTARVEKVLTGKSEIEHSFLENYFIPDSFKAQPLGMFPECYPGDHYNGGFIPNWAMWLVIELEEYYERTKDREFIENAKKRIYALLDYFVKFENTDGLLEKLGSWIFVEWSKANELTQDINYPTNMLYAKMLRSAGNLYSDNNLIEKAEKIKEKINEQAITESGFYCDNAVYGEDGIAHLSGKCTETCQYYAFFCEVATPDKNPVLFERLLNDFGPHRVEEGKWPDLCENAKWRNIYPSNAFIGNYLRLEILFRYGEHKKLIENIRGYFLKMAELTGTLWENDTPTASCNHGFASHVLYWMDGLGLIK